MLDRDRVHEVFAEAMALKDAARTAFLESACAGDAELRAEIESLLAAAEGGPAFMAAPSTLGSGPAERPGAQIGPYRLLQEIGEGGFGTVYVAEQQHPVRRTVALKIIKLGMDTRAIIARFEAERQALAMMDHAGIARVLDAGATDSGRPYFVMELVHGDPITCYCDRNNLNIGERLDLFVQVCHAVQHAHAKGVIHRDLKPTNVLVATQDGRPHAKVIDFGIAKAAQQRLTETTLFTEFRQLIGTPEYMSPEQAAGSRDIDTRSDVYSLGVLLYELLTGATPFDPKELRSAAFAEIQRIIREVEPPKPSTRLSQSFEAPGVAAHRGSEPARLSALVRGDLDWIVMKALDKDRARRYDTPSALAADVTRHLTGEPVTAAPPSAAYRTRKFVRRNRALVVSGIAVALALVLGVIGTSTGLVMANAARADEQAHRKAAQQSAMKAEAEARRAAAAEAEAERRRVEAEYDGYVANITAALGALRVNDVRLAAKRLDACPTHLRNWEWRFLDAASDESLLAIEHPPQGPGGGPRARYSPDGRRIATAGFDGVVRIFDAERGTTLAELRGHTGAATDARFSPDGGRILSAGRDGTLRLWDAGGYRELAVLPGHALEGGAPRGSFTRDGSRVISCSADVARVWDGFTGQELARLSGHTGVISEALPSPDGTRVLTASHDQTARIWDAATGAELLVLRGHTGPIVGADFSPAGDRVATGAYDGTARVWDTATGREVARLDDPGNVGRAVFSPDGSRVLTSAGPTPRIWDLATARELVSLAGHSRHVTGAEFTPDGRRILTWSEDTTARVWDAESGRQLWLMRGHRNTPQSASFSPDGSRVLTSGDRTVRLWGKHPTCDDQVVPEPLPDTIGAGFSPDGSLIFESGLARVRVFDPQTAAVSWMFGRTETPTSPGAFSPDGRLFATSFEDLTVRIWDIGAGRTMLTFRAHEAPINDVRFSPDGQTIVTASDDKTVRTWNAWTGEPVRVLEGHDEAVLSASFDETGEYIVSASADRSARIWNARTGAELRRLLGHAQGVLCARFSRDGTRVLTTSLDYTARVWNPLSGTEQLVLRGHEMIVVGGEFLPDGSRIVTASVDGTARLWDSRTGRELLSLQAGPGSMNTAEFSRDGTRLLLFSGVGDARILDSVPLRERFAQASSQR